MTKFADAVAAATAKSADLQRQIEALTDDKALADKLIAEAAQLSADSIELFDKLAADLAAQPQDGNKE